MKRILIVFVSIVFVMFFIGCNEEDNLKDDNNKVTETLDITETSLELELNETYTFNMDIEVVITSNNQEVVSVDNKTITALKEGNATVTITLKSNETVKKEVSVTVKFPTFSFLELLDFDYYYRYYNKKEYDSIIEELIKYEFDSNFEKNIRSIVVFLGYGEQYLMRKSVRERFLSYFENVEFEYVKEGDDYRKNKEEKFHFFMSAFGDDFISYGSVRIYLLDDGTCYMDVSFENKGPNMFVGKIDESISADELATYVKENKDFLSWNTYLKVGESITIDEGLNIKISAEDESLIKIEGNTITALKEGKTKLIVEYEGEDFKQENYVYIEQVDEGE